MKFPVNQPYNITTRFDINTHPGIDIAPVPAGSTGIQCYAPENASVIESQMLLPVEGNYIKLRGDSGMYYYFGHFNRRLVAVGERVSEGQPIGILGMTGQADGIHTHHEVRRTSRGDQVDPIEYYKDKENKPVPEKEVITIIKDRRVTRENLMDVANTYFWTPPEKYIAAWIDQSFTDMWYNLSSLKEAQNARNAYIVATSSSLKPYDGPQLFTK